MSIEFIKPGLQTSLQDSGMFRQMHNGIAHSGAMDPLAMRLANWLVSKPLTSAVVEITLSGPSLKFHSQMAIAICGAEFELYLNDSPIINNRTIHVDVGDLLEFRKLQNGTRAYLAFSGSPQLEKMNGSYSTNLVSGFGGFHGKVFKYGDTLSLKDSAITPLKNLPDKLQLSYSNHLQLRVTAGMEQNWFTDEQQQLFYSQSYLVSSESNRMGLRLGSENKIHHSAKQLTSTGLVEGSIQVPPSGLPIITSVEGQTIGGYPRIANVISADLPLLGQLKPGNRINFLQISIDGAQEILRDKNRLIETLLNLDSR